jgi:hypothetical protein
VLCTFGTAQTFDWYFIRLIIAIGSLGIAVMVTPAVALLAGGSATAARTGGSSRQIRESLAILSTSNQSHPYNIGWLLRKYFTSLCDSPPGKSYLQERYNIEM